MTGPNDKKTRDLTNDNGADEDVPEFQGLFERRNVNHQGIPLVDRYYEHQTTEDATRLSQKPAAKDPELEDDTSDTQALLKALDNSAIRLADSGIFKIDEED